MIQRLIILGLLKKTPSSGYDIKKFIDKELGMFSQLDTSSIYYPLKKMEAEGLIVKREIKGGRLKKFLYSITPKGEKEFIRLSKEALRSQRRPFIEIDIPLYFLDFLDKDEIFPILRLRMLFLKRVKDWLEKKRVELKSAPPNIQLLIRHHLKLASAERSFIKAMLEAIKKEKSGLRQHSDE